MKPWPCILALIFITCTNPFSTREPEEPGQSGQSWIPPRRPEFVLQNLTNAILEQNLENYLRSLSDSSRGGRPFRYIPDEGVARESPGAFVDWGIANERAYFSQLRALTPADSLHFLVLQDVQTTVSGDSAIYVEDYTLTIRHMQQNQGVPAVTSGQAKFWLGVDTFGDWAIYRWEDRARGGEPTWSVLKEIYGK